MNLPWDSIVAWRLNGAGRPPSSPMAALAVVDAFVGQLAALPWLEVDLFAPLVEPVRWEVTLVVSPKTRPDIRVVAANLSGTSDPTIVWNGQAFTHPAELASHLLDVTPYQKLKPEFEARASEDLSLESCPHVFVVPAAERNRCVGEVYAGARVIEFDATPFAAVPVGEVFRGGLVHLGFDFEVVGAKVGRASLRGTLRSRSPMARPTRVLKASDVLARLRQPG